jgi:ribonuclease HI
MNSGYYRIWTDGGSRGNPGRCGAGGIIKDPHGNVISQISEYLGIQTNNYAEYKALIITLEKAIVLNIKEVEVFLDSKLVVEQMNGKWKVKNENIIPLYNEAKELILHFNSIKFTHVRRAFNKEADALANKAMDYSY